jgi:hypothetical protein
MPAISPFNHDTRRINSRPGTASSVDSTTALKAVQVAVATRSGIDTARIVDDGTGHRSIKEPLTRLP